MAMIEMARIQPFEDVTQLLDRPEALRVKAEEEGLLFFKGLLDADKVSALRSQILNICNAHGWIQEGTPPENAIAELDAKVLDIHLDHKWKAIYNDVQKLRDFHALALDPEILNVCQTLFGESVLPHSRNICRVVFPDSATHSTPPHQDNFYWSRKPANALTAYIAITKQTEKNGAICYLLGSHKQGVLQHKRSSVKAFSSYIDNPQITNKSFHSPKLQSGDVVFHHCNIVHKANSNQYSSVKHDRKSLAIVIYGVSALEDKKLRKKYLRNNQKI